MHINPPKLEITILIIYFFEPSYERVYFKLHMRYASRVIQCCFVFLIGCYCVFVSYSIP